MARRHQYITLIASLPPLQFFDRAERLPINEIRLRQRLTMLQPADRRVVERTADFLAWQRQPVERTDTQVVALFQGMTDLAASYPVLMQAIESRMNSRTIMAALRRRQRGASAPTADEPWGVGPWVAHIERNWDDPTFRLSGIFRWVEPARQHLIAGETLALERLLMQQIWHQVDRIAHANMFSFEAVVAYLFKWDILQRWLSYNRAPAQTRFEALVTEVIGEHEQLFDRHS
ncbi:MAG: DUF2764 family protein [Hyphomicrobium sp.]